MYNTWFYDTIRPGVQESARVIVPMVMDVMRPGSAGDYAAPMRVVDVGCGEGWWAEAFTQQGCCALGVDGAYVPFLPESETLRFRSHDLNAPVPDVGVFDLAVSLEVAEHLHPLRADGFVQDLCRLADAVLFSAAIPGQGGAGHVNEQWPAYWVERFERQGYRVSGALRWKIWDNPLVENWYRQNLLFATKHPDDYPELFNTPLSEPWAVIHPVLYNARRA